MDVHLLWAFLPVRVVASLHFAQVPFTLCLLGPDVSKLEESDLYHGAVGREEAFMLLVAAPGQFGVVSHRSRLAVC